MRSIVYAAPQQIPLTGRSAAQLSSEAKLTIRRMASQQARRGHCCHKAFVGFGATTAAESVLCYASIKKTAMFRNSSSPDSPDNRHCKKVLRYLLEV